MRNRLDIPVQMSALHHALIEQFPETARHLCVGGFDGNWIEIIYPEPHEGLETTAAHIPALYLWPERDRLAANGEDGVLVHVRGSSELETINLTVYTSQADRTDVEVALTDGIGMMEVRAVQTGKITIERIDDRYFSRVVLEAS